MCLFLICDESDPAIDYNTEDLPPVNTNNYALIVDSFLQGANYILNNLTPNMTEDAVTKVVFDGARASEMDMRSFFSRMYQLLFKQPSGPKLASLIVLLGPDVFSSLLTNRLASPLNY